jgi:hypothetical protein
MEELLYFLFYVKSAQYGRRVGREATRERSGRIGQLGANILPSEIAGRATWFYKGNEAYAPFDSKYPTDCGDFEVDV